MDAVEMTNQHSHANYDHVLTGASGSRGVYVVPLAAWDNDFDGDNVTFLTLVLDQTLKCLNVEVPAGPLGMHGQTVQSPATADNALDLVIVNSKPKLECHVQEDLMKPESVTRTTVKLGSTGNNGLTVRMVLILVVKGPK